MRRRKKNNDFIMAGEVVPRAIKHLSASPEYKFYLIRFYWEDIVGKDIAEHALPKRFAFGVLYVGTAGSAWANNLLYMKYEIIDKINTALKYKLIKDIHFTYGRKGSNKIIPERIKDKKSIKRILGSIELSQEDKDDCAAKCQKLHDQDIAEELKKVLLINKKINILKQNNNWHKCLGCDALCPPEEKYCDVCGRENKRKKDASIRKILLTKPWARYSEIKNYVKECTAQMVNKERTGILQRMMTTLKIKSYDDMELQIIVMLYRAMPPEQINKKVVKETINKLKYDLIYNEMKKLK